MYEIRFALPSSARQMYLEVQQRGDARDVWDRLAKNFRMISDRP